MAANSERAVKQALEKYQKARMEFVQAIADLSQNTKNIETLKKEGIMGLLRPLLLDTFPSVQHTAAQALARLANHSPELAMAVVNADILPQLVYSLADQNKFYKSAAASVLRSVSRHSPQLAQKVVESGAAEALVSCLEVFDPQVKEAAAWAIGYIARHNAGIPILAIVPNSSELSQSVVDAGAVPLLVLCVQEPELGVKRIAASALSDIAKHTPELAKEVVDKGAVGYLAPLISNKDAKLKRQVCSCLSQIAKHSVELAELVVEAEIFPAVLDRLKDTDSVVKKNAATLVREIAKHTPELSALIVNAGGVAAVVDYVIQSKLDTSPESKGSGLPGIMTLGYIASFSETMAKAVIDARGIPPLLECLKSDNEDHVRSASAWTLGQIGRHSPEHAEAVANENTLIKLLEAFDSNESSEDLKTKAKRALKGIIEKCTSLPALEPLIDSNPSIQQYVIHQFAKILPNNPSARKDFVTKGCLQKIQLIQAESGSKLKDYILTINNCYPEEIVLYYSPNYSKILLSKIEDSTNQPQNVN